MCDKKRIGVFAGSFDPVTLGHLDLVKRAGQLFDQVYVLVAVNPNKAGRFTGDQRLTFINQGLAELGVTNAQAVLADSLVPTVALAKELGATHLVRGVRNATDLDYEDSLAYFNSQLAPDLDTVVLLSPPQYRYLSSSRVRELIALKQDIRPYVPTSVALEVEKTHETP